jgi:hypothetical protein
LICLKESYIPMHLFVSNMADQDISDYEFDAHDLLSMPS